MSDFWTVPHLPAVQHQLVGVALILWAVSALWRAREYEVWWPRIAVLLVTILGSAVLFARLLALAAGDVTAPWWNPLSAGYSSFGLFAGAAIALLVLTRIVAPLGPLLDIVVPGSLTALATVRLGCLFRGCDFGGPADWGVRYASESPVSTYHPSLVEAASSAVVHPLPVYLSIAALLGSSVAVAVSKASRPGRSLVGALVYFLMRAMIEPLRSSESAWHWLDINANVILSLVAALLCVAFLKAFENHEDRVSGT